LVATSFSFLGVYGSFLHRDSVPFVVVCRFRAPLHVKVLIVLQGVGTLPFPGNNMGSSPIEIAFLTKPQVEGGCRRFTSEDPTKMLYIEIICIGGFSLNPPFHKTKFRKFEVNWFVTS
jgi:hypothetical protein